MITVIFIIKVMIIKNKWITKIITPLLTCVIIKTIMMEITKMFIITMMIMIVIIVTVISKILLTWCKIGNGEMRMACLSKTPKKTKMLKSIEYSNSHEPVSQG